MKRVDLSWALKAVLPHVGTEAAGLKHVGLEYRAGQLYVFATDKYTAGIARVNDGINVCGSLSKEEATELEQFVRTSYKTEEEDDLAYAEQPGELHIGFARQIDRLGERAEDSAVFELDDPGTPSLDYLLETIARVNGQPVEWDEQIYQPKLFERFAKAERGDRLRVFPRHADDRRGVAIVTVGQDFLGMISGLTYDEEGPATLAEWPLPAGLREAA